MKNFMLILFAAFLVVSCEKSDPPLIEDEVVIDPDPVVAVSEPCVNGMAGDYPCKDYDLVSHLNINLLGGSSASGNDCWGWTDPSTQREYAIMCTTSGTTFVDVTDGVDPTIIGQLPTHTSQSSWRDAKTYGNYVFIVSEASGHGMQVFDLTRLRNADVSNGPITFTEDAHYSGFGNAHNIVINEENAYAYAVGTLTFLGGPHFVDISDPLNPVAAGGYDVDRYSHDAQVVTYNGPDPDYQGREILIGSNENEVVIVDVTDKNNPSRISTIDYANIGYTHQGWFTEDMRYFILGDELDERDFGLNTRTLVFDFLDLDNPVEHFTYFGNTVAIDHNGYVKGDTFFLANYTAGVRMIDISNIGTSMSEVGFFDTYPSNNGTSFNGVWNVYPYFPSGNILVSDINSGMFLIRKSE
jgi:choice-of-anchor B domain-containing protein